MTTIELKAEIKKLIEKENDPGILKAIRTLLKKTSLDSDLKEKLTSRALKSNEDINAGRLYTRKEIENETDDMI